jgi:hypothetical protein
LALAAEFENGGWRGEPSVWRNAVVPELEKVLMANSDVAVLVASREYDGEPEAAFAALDEVVASTAQRRRLLLVVLLPPRNAAKRGCVAHGVVYDEQGKRLELPSVECW